jgi:hypothetical protein
MKHRTDNHLTQKIYLYIDPTDDDAARNLKSAIEKASELGKKLSTASKEDYKDISFELNDYLSDVSSISALISGKSSIEKSNILMNTLKWRKLKTKLTQKIEVHNPYFSFNKNLYKNQTVIARSNL